MLQIALDQHSQRSPAESVTSSSCVRSRRIPRSSSHKHQTRSPYSRSPLVFPRPLSLSLSAAPLPQSLFSLSLCEVWCSCCFPCGDCNDVLWHRQVSCSLLLSGSRVIAVAEEPNTAIRESCLFFKGFSGFKQPWGFSLWNGCEVKRM